MRSMNAYEKIVRDLLESDDPKVVAAVKRMLPHVELVYGGIRFSVAPSLNYTEYSLWKIGRPPEHKAINYLQKLFAGRNVVVVDVGANVGLFSLPLVPSAANTSQFVLLEPNPDVFFRLKENVSNNHLPNVKLVRCAVSDVVGSATLYLDPRGNEGAARLGRVFDQKSSSIKVATRTMTDIIDEFGLGHIDLIKVDVEGFEDRVLASYLRGGSGRNVDRIYVEVAHNELWVTDLFGLLHSSGFKQEATFGENILFKRNLVR